MDRNVITEARNVLIFWAVSWKHKLLSCVIILVLFGMQCTLSVTWFVCVALALLLLNYRTGDNWMSNKISHKRRAFVKILHAAVQA